MSTTINDLTVIWVLQMCLYVFNTMRRQFDEEVEQLSHCTKWRVQNSLCFTKHSLSPSDTSQTAHITRDTRASCIQWLY